MMLRTRPIAIRETPSLITRRAQREAMRADFVCEPGARHLRMVDESDVTRAEALAALDVEDVMVIGRSVWLLVDWLEMLTCSEAELVITSWNLTADEVDRLGGLDWRRLTVITGDHVRPQARASLGTLRDVGARHARFKGHLKVALVITSERVVTITSSVNLARERSHRVETFHFTSMRAVAQMHLAALRAHVHGLPEVR